MKVWLRQQSRALDGAARKLASSPFATVFNVLVLGIALALPSALYVGLANLQSAARSVSPAPQLTLFMSLDATRADVREIDTRLKRHDQVAQLTYLPRDKAFEDLKRGSGMAGAAEALGHNPLPDAFVVDARDSAPAALEALRAELAGWPKVGFVQLDTEWAHRLDAILKVGRILLVLLTALLAFALVAVTFNTIRLQILTHRLEIEVATLIGATAGFIRRPFLYYGALLGLLGGIAACALAWVATAVLNAALVDLSYLYASRWTLAFLTFADTAALFVFAAGLGWLGAWLSVTRHLAEARAR